MLANLNGNSNQLSHNPSPIVIVLYGVQHEVVVCALSTSAEQRGITRQVFAALGCTQWSTVAACLTQCFKFSTVFVKKSVLQSSDQQFVDGMCWLI